MAGNIKGITVEIGGNTQPLVKALDDVNRKGRSLQSELKTIDKLLKLDPTNTVLLSQKQQVLAESINNTKTKLDSLKTAQEQARQQLANGDIGEDQYRALTREVEATEMSLNRLENEARETDAALEAAGNESAETAQDIRKVGDASRQSADETQNMSSRSAVSFAAITAAVTMVINTVTQLISKFKDAALSSATWADDINTMAAQYHVSTESLQKFAYAADLVDVSVETFGSSLGKLTKNMEKAEGGTKAQKEAFDRLGVSVTDSNGNMRSAEDVFYDVIDALGEMENETEADVTANALFGRSFQDLNPLVAAGTDKLKELGAEAEAVGFVMSRDALDASNNLQDSLDRLKNMTEMSKRSFAQGLAPALDRITQSMNESLANPKTQEMLRKFGEVVGEIAEGFMSFANVILENGDIILTVITSIGAGFAMWKITAIIQGVITHVKNFVTGFADGAKSIIANIKAMDSATMATLIGAIAAVIVAVIQLTDMFLGASEAARDFKDDAENINSTAQGLASEFSKTSETLAINADTARNLAVEIHELDGKIKSGELSAAELAATQARLQAKTVEYNTAVGEEALKIDEATGAIEGSTDAILQNTEALIENAQRAAEVQALTDAYQAQTEAQAQTAAGLLEIKSHYDELSESQRALIDQMEEEGVSAELLSRLWWDSPITGGQVNNEVRTLIEGMEETVEAEEAAANQVEALTSTMEENAAALAENGDALDEHKQGLEVQTQAVSELTDAEALRVLRMQENGEQIDEVLAAQLETYKQNNSDTYSAMEEMIKKERDYANARLSIITNSNEAIELENKTSLSQRAENLKHNNQIWQDYETNRTKISQNAHSTMTSEQAQAVDRMLELYSDGSKESIEIIAQMAADIEESGGQMTLDFADAILDAMDSKMPDVSKTFEDDGKEINEAVGKGMDESKAVEETTGQIIEDANNKASSMISDGRFSSLGQQIANEMAKGINSAASSIYSAVDSIVANIKSKFSFSVSASATGKGAKVSAHHAKGAVVYKREIAEIAETEPEAVIPLSRMGDVIEGILNHASGSGSSGAGKTVYFQPSVNIYAQKLTDSELRRATDFVSREFAKVTGGRM